MSEPIITPPSISGSLLIANIETDDLVLKLDFKIYSLAITPHTSYLSPLPC